MRLDLAAVFGEAACLVARDFGERMLAPRLGFVNVFAVFRFFAMPLLRLPAFARRR